MSTASPNEHDGSVQQVPAVRQGLRMWGNRFLWVLPSLLALYVVLKMADFIWFRTQLPVTLANANWSGTWETKQYFGLSGNLIVRLPDPLPVDEDFKATALVYYPIYSLWRTGQFVKMEFEGRFSPDSSSSGGRTNNAIPGGGGKLSFKGAVGIHMVQAAP
jgi:hypothetical protein